MGRILRQIACAAGVMALVPTSRQLHKPSARGPQRSTLRMSSQLETLEPQLKRVVITGMGIAQCMNQIVALWLNPGMNAVDATPLRPERTHLSTRAQAS